MTNISPDICRQIKDARRAAKIGQIELAAEVGCKQSALSMFEQGNPTKLNDDVVRKLAAKFDIKLEEAVERGSSERTFQTGNVATAAVRGFCPNPHCPSNRSYQVEGRTLYLPDRDVADPVGGKFCATCGEILIRICPNCGAPVHAGAICSFCGEPYVAN